MPAKRKQSRNRQSWVQLAKNFVDQWPEVLEGIELTNMPISYLDNVRIILKNHITIQVDIKECLKKLSRNKVSAMLKSYINKNYSNIKNVDLKFDVLKLKKDMESKTSTLMSKTFKK